MAAGAAALPIVMGALGAAGGIMRILKGDPSGMLGVMNGVAGLGGAGGNPIPAEATAALQQAGGTIGQLGGSNQLPTTAPNGDKFKMWGPTPDGRQMTIDDIVNKGVPSPPPEVPSPINLANMGVGMNGIASKYLGRV